MLKRMNLILLVVLLAVLCGGEAFARGSFRPPLMHLRLAVNDREQDGLLGPVRRVKTETAKITVKNGKPTEGPRVLLETTTYDNKGTRIDNAYFLAAGGSLTGREVYKYDDKGNIIEMTMQKEDGSLISKEVYNYEFDPFGNWTKMTTSVAVMEGGKVTFEPTEVTYRTIAYYLEETTVAKMSQPAAPQTASAPAATPNAANAKQSDKSAAKVAPITPAIMTAAMDKSSLTPPLMVVANAGAGDNSSAPVIKPDGDAPPRPVMRGPLKPVSGGILNGKALSLPAPLYPDVAKRTRASGTVSVEVVIDVTGKVISAKAVGGPVLLLAAAEKAALAARFSPTLLSGNPVRVTGIITYNFTLGQ